MSGKRQAASPPADEPDAKQAKGDDADAKAGADAENAGAEAGGDDPMETEENGRGDAPARRSLRTRNPVRKAATRNEGKAAKANATGARAFSSTPQPQPCFLSRSDVARRDENEMMSPEPRRTRPPAPRRASVRVAATRAVPLPFAAPKRRTDPAPPLSPRDAQRPRSRR